MSEELDDSMEFDESDLYTADAEGQDAGPSLDDMMYQNLTMCQPYLLSEEDIYTAGDEMPQPSAPLDIAGFKIKVDWTEPFPERWRARLQKALQSWLSRLEGTASVHSVKLMDDPSCAEVQITPSTALKVLKYHRTASLHFKNIKDGKVKGDKEVTAHIYLNEAHSVTVEKFLLEENKASSSKVNNTKPVTSVVSEDTNNSEDVVAANSASNDAEITKTFKRTPETSAGLTVPLYQFWYLLHAYRKEVEKIEKQHGVIMQSEVLVSFRSTQRSSSDSVSKASKDFQKLVSDCVVNFSEAAINHKDMNLDIVKEAIHTIQSEEAKLMLTMSASNCLFFGPNKFTDMIKRETTRVEQQFKDKSNESDVDNNVSPQGRFSLDMDTKDLLTQLEMDKVCWDLMNLSYKEQLSQLETKYGVSFNEEKLQKNVIKVQARSKGVQHINLESHALRALTQLYQKLASTTVSCKLTTPTDKTDVAPLLEKLQQQHHCVVAADELSPWRLVGLPEHLGPAITDIEKTLQKNVFDDKMKKLIGCSGDIPHSREINWNQTPDYGSGAVGGAVWDERGSFRGQGKADTGFNEDSEGNSRHDSKGAHAEEETCTICMDSFIDKRKLKCGHEFCRVCLSMSVESLGPICPVCKEVFGKMEGNQPDGKMHVTNSRWSLPGYPYCGTIEIPYNIPSGIQTQEICKNGDINTTQSQASAPLDIASLKIKVDWTDPFPDKWRKKFQMAIQSWLSKLEGTASLHSIEFMDDPSCAQVQITPSTALETLQNHRTVSLNFKHENKDATAHIILDEAHSVTVSQNTSTSDKNRILSSKNLPASSVKGQDSRSSLDEQKHQDITTNKSDSQPEEQEICKNGDINTTQSQPSAPLDIASLKIKVDWTDPFPDKWRRKFQMAIQSWLSKLEETASVLSIEFMDDPSCAHVQITPSTALETLENHRTVSLNFKHENKDVTAHIILDEAHSVTVSQNTVKTRTEQRRTRTEFYHQRFSLDMDIEDLPTQLEMDKVHWDLINLSGVWRF